jgi:hypothetical protein
VFPPTTPTTTIPSPTPATPRILESTSVLGGQTKTIRTRGVSEISSQFSREKESFQKRSRNQQAMSKCKLKILTNPQKRRKKKRFSATIVATLIISAPHVPDSESVLSVKRRSIWSANALNGTTHRKLLNTMEMPTKVLDSFMWKWIQMKIMRLWDTTDNHGVLTIEEEDMEQEEIIQNLKRMFDKDWQWKLKPMDNYKYMIKFPPSKRVESTSMGDVIWFPLSKEGVMASLKMWDGEIKTIGKLKEAWV